MTDKIQSFKDQLQESGAYMLDQALKVIPTILIAIIVVLAGRFIARLISKIIRRTLEKINLDELAEKSNVKPMFEKMGLKDSLAILVEKIIYWTLMLIMLITLADVLGLEMLSEQFNKIINFLPKIFSALVIFVVGFVVATKIKDLLVNVTSSLGSSTGKLVANIVYYFLIIMLSITSLDQTGINTDLISSNIVIIIALIVFSGSLAYSFAARDMVKNLLTAYSFKGKFIEGQVIRIGDVEGEIIEISKMDVTILTKENHKVVVPASQFSAKNVIIIKDAEEQ